MPRKGPAPRRPLIIDPVYSSPLVSQLVKAARVHRDPTLSWLDIVERGYIVAGTPETVVDQLGALADTLNVGHLMVQLTFGNLGFDVGPNPSVRVPLHCLHLAQAALVALEHFRLIGNGDRSDRNPRDDECNGAKLL